MLQTVTLSDDEKELIILDQRRLPGEVRYLRLRQKEEMKDAISTLAVRGAPAIGVFAGYAMYILGERLREKEPSFKECLKKYRELGKEMANVRPTAVNLSRAVNRMVRAMEEERSLYDEARTIHQKDIDTNKKIGEYGLSLLKPGMGILTHCNAGALATTAYGTATSPLYLGHEKGYGFHVYCDETRPLLQGARLTSFELSQAGMDVTVLCDDMSASLMSEGRIDAIFIGCDRVAANGDAANKIGSLSLSIAARYYGVPFYVCAPTSTIDMDTISGKDIVIEQRDGEEIRSMWYEKPMVPEGVGIYNPAFDVVPSENITAMITENGIYTNTGNGINLKNGVIR